MNIITLKFLEAFFFLEFDIILSVHYVNLVNVEKVMRSTIFPEQQDASDRSRSSVQAKRNNKSKNVLIRDFSFIHTKLWAA